MVFNCSAFVQRSWYLFNRTKSANVEDLVCHSWKVQFANWYILTKSITTPGNVYWQDKGNPSQLNHNLEKGRKLWFLPNCQIHHCFEVLHIWTIKFKDSVLTSGCTWKGHYGRQVVIWTFPTLLYQSSWENKVEFLTTKLQEFRKYQHKNVLTGIFFLSGEWIIFYWCRCSRQNCQSRLMFSPGFKNSQHTEQFYLEHNNCKKVSRTLIQNGEIKAFWAILANGLLEPF